MKFKLSLIPLILILCGGPISADEKTVTPHLEPPQSLKPAQGLEPVQSLPPAQENTEKTPVLEQEKPMENLNLEIKEKKRLKKSSHKGKKVKESNGKIALIRETKSLQKNKESHLVKQGKLTREQLDFREKDKTEYAF